VFAEKSDKQLGEDESCQSSSRSRDCESSQGEHGERAERVTEAAEVRDRGRVFAEARETVCSRERRDQRVVTIPGIRVEPISSFRVKVQ
jgi:hypothetical protein